MSDETVYVVVGDDGSPIGVFDKDKIEDDGIALAFELASVCDDEEEVTSLLEETLKRVGDEAFGYIATSALAIMTRQILEPTLRVTDTLGVFLRPGLHKIAYGGGEGGAE